MAVAYNVTVNAPGTGTPTGNVTVSDGVDSCTASVAAGTCNITLTTAGARSLTATYVGDGNFNTSTSTPGTPHPVNKADTTTSITSDTPDPSVVGQPVAVGYSVTVTAPGSGTPTGNVTVSDGTDSCTAAVSAGTCNITFTSAGAKSLTATYRGRHELQRQHVDAGHATPGRQGGHDDEHHERYAGSLGRRSVRRGERTA